MSSQRLIAAVDLGSNSFRLEIGRETHGQIARVDARRVAEIARGQRLDTGLQGAFDVGGPVDKDKTLLYRLTGVLRDSDAQIAKFSDKVKDDRAYIAPAITWRPTNDTTLTLLSDYQHDVTGNAFPQSVATVRGGKVVNVDVLSSSPRGVFDGVVRAAVQQYGCVSAGEGVTQVADQTFEFKPE